MCTGAGAGSGSTRFRRTVRRFGRRLRRRFRGGVGAEPGHRVPERLWCVARSGSTGFQGSGEGLGAFGAAGQVQQGFPEKVWEALVQSQVRFNRVPEKVSEKVSEKVPGSLGAKPSQVQRGPEKVAEQVAEKVLGGIFGAGSGQDRVSSAGFPALGFAARFRKICKNTNVAAVGEPTEAYVMLYLLKMVILQFATLNNQRVPAKIGHLCFP